MAGYSSTPLARKLGIQPGSRVLPVCPPSDYWALVGVSPDQVIVASARAATLDFVHLFATRRSELARKLPGIRRRLAPAGMIWVSWPKRAAVTAGTAPASTDVTGATVRALALAHRLVDVKVCAVDEVWSGLKLVIPVSARGRSRR